MSNKPKSKKTKLNKSNNTAKDLQKIIPMNNEQRLFIDLIKTKNIIICDAIHGTGKSFLSLVESLKLIHGDTPYDKLLYVRSYVPSIGCDEDLGSLPGDMNEKIGAFFLPILDNLEGLVSRERIAQYCSDEVIQVTTPSFLRGRSLNNTIVVFDEAQNANLALFKLVISRLTDTAKLIIIGSSDQIDLKRPERSFLRRALDRLSSNEYCGCCVLTDVVRSSYTQWVLEDLVGDDPYETM